MEQCIGNLGSNNLSFGYIQRGKTQISTSGKTLTVQAQYSDGERSGSASIFVGGFLLGGLVIGTLGCVYAPQISKAVAGAKLPKFMYDEEKALEKTRKILADKIAHLNSAIDDVSAQLRSEDSENGAAPDADDLEAIL